MIDIWKFREKVRVRPQMEYYTTPKTPPVGEGCVGPVVRAQ